MKRAVSLKTMVWVEAESDEEACKIVSEDIGTDDDGELLFHPDEFEVVDVDDFE